MSAGGEMALGFSTDLREGMRFLKGAFDEIADFDPLLAMTEQPLKLNLRGIEAINSLGLRRLIAFSRSFGERAIEFHDCPPVFVEAVNVIPLSIGGQSKIGRIKSLWLPFHCKGDHEQNISVPVEAIKVKDGIVMPMTSCATCKMPMTPGLDTDLEEFFFFLTA